MTFIHSYLLFGLALAALPVVIHLIMRQKPKQLSFPAFRFLKQKVFINRRKLQIQHLILLLLRMLLIAALCLGLARPRVVSHQISLNNEKAVAAVFLFDTSMSMEYAVAGAGRLDEAKDRARELLEEMSEDSDVAILDSGDESVSAASGAEWLRPAAARTRIDNLRLRPANGPLNRQIDRAFALLKSAGDAEEAKPRFLYIFSDRTRESWDAGEAKRLERPEGVGAIFVDVGVDNPRDLAIDKVEVEPSVVAPGGTVQIRATIRSTGGDHDTKLTCQLDNEPDPARQPDEKPIALGKGQSQLIVIDRPAPSLPEGFTELPFQLKVQLATNDALPFNNSRYATFLVRQARKVLAIADDPADAHIWKTALNAVKAFHCEVMTPLDAEKLDAKGLSAYKIVCLFQLNRPSAGLLDKLQAFVRAGGGLVLVPGGMDVKPGVDDYNREAGSRGLLPARWGSIAELVSGRFPSAASSAAAHPVATLVGKRQATRQGVLWSGFNAQHPLTAPFREWARAGNPDFVAPETQPFVNAFWDVTPVDNKAVVISSYAEPGRRPALIERPFGQGIVIQFTTPLDGKPLSKNRPWHNYWEDSSFGLVLVDLVCKYLAGDMAAPELNYTCGVPPLVAAPPPPPNPPYALQGPNLTAAETNLAFADGANKLAVPQAVSPGNYTVLDGKKRLTAGFSVNVRAEESQLERVPIEEIEPVLGQGSVLPVGRKASLKDALQGHWAPPLEMMPWLMMAVLTILVMESLMANRFYRKESQSETRSNIADH